MKTRTNQPIYKDDGTLLTDEDLGGNEQLYMHEIDLPNLTRKIYNFNIGSSTTYTGGSENIKLYVVSKRATRYNFTREIFEDYISNNYSRIYYKDANDKQSSNIQLFNNTVIFAVNIINAQPDLFAQKVIQITSNTTAITDTVTPL